jgi:beta-1,4-mannosyl-glycoprotein beta-1,4-N-acetylglucosaminyltransferase
MYDFVDYFVLVESTKTFSDKDKPLYYQNNKHLFEKWRDKILHVIVDDIDMPKVKDPDDFEIIGNQSNDENWTRERFQRNSCMKALKKLDLRNDDVILINDVDEIINQNVLDYFKRMGVSGLYVLALDAYLYSLRYKVNDTYPARICTGARAIDWESLLEIGTPDKVRNTFLHNKEYYPNGAKNDRLYAWIIPNCGWHFSYFGTKEDIIKKINSYSHQELNNDVTINNLDDFINSGKYISSEYTTSIIEIGDNNNLPNNYRILL